MPTTRRGYPYPDPQEGPRGPGAMSALASAIDTDMGNVARAATDADNAAAAAQARADGAYQRFRSLTYLPTSSLTFRNGNRSTIGGWGYTPGDPAMQGFDPDPQGIDYEGGVFTIKGTRWFVGVIQFAFAGVAGGSREVAFQRLSDNVILSRGIQPAAGGGTQTVQCILTPRLITAGTQVRIAGLVDGAPDTGVPSSNLQGAGLVELRGIPAP